MRLEISAPETASQLGIGDSVSVSGACLTATAVSNGTFSVTAVAETLSRTTLGRLSPDDDVNLETATRAGDPLGGHFVQGHVDGLGRVASVGDDGRVWVEAGPEILRYCVEKGSIAVDGVSLTIAGLARGRLRGRADPAHARSHHAGRRSNRATRSISRSTCSPSTSKSSSHRDTISGA